MGSDSEASMTSLLRNEIGQAEAKMYARISRFRDDTTMSLQNTEERLNAALNSKVGEVQNSFAKLKRADESDKQVSHGYCQLQEDLQRRVSELESQFQALVLARSQQDQGMAQVKEHHKKVSFLDERMVGAEEAIHELTQTCVTNANEITALEARLKGSEETLCATENQITSETMNRQSNTLAALCEEVAILTLRMPTAERLSKQAAEIPGIVHALKEAQCDIAMQAGHVKVLSEERPSNCNCADCFHRGRSILEELDALTSRVAKTETAVSFVRTELETVRDALAPPSQKVVGGKVAGDSRTILSIKT